MPLTDVATYRQWAEQGRQVRRGETGLRIVAPKGRDTSSDTPGDQAEPEATSRHTTRNEDDQPEQDGQDGRTRFRMVGVFDISQTDPMEEDS